MTDINTRTVKLDIGDQSIYIIYCFDSPEDSFIDITLGHENEDNDITTSGSDSNRCLLQSVCSYATELLHNGTWTVDDLIKDWAGRNGVPNGYCPQLNKIKMFPTGPLDAASWYFMSLKAKQEVEKKDLLAVIERLLIDRDFLCLQLDYEYGNVTADEFAQLSKSFLDRNTSRLYGNVLSDGFMVLSEILQNLPRNFDAETVAVILGCPMDQAEEMIKKYRDE